MYWIILATPHRFYPSNFRYGKRLELHAVVTPGGETSWRKAMVSTSQKLESVLSSWKMRASQINCRLVRVGTVAFDFSGRLASLDSWSLVIVNPAGNELRILLNSHPRIVFTGTGQRITLKFSDKTEIGLEQSRITVYDGYSGGYARAEAQHMRPPDTQMDSPPSMQAMPVTERSLPAGAVVKLQLSQAIRK